MTRGLLPFFSYFGSKYRLAPRYPQPVHDMIIEPFAGSACYATRLHQHEVLLLDKDPVIANLWQYLIDATPADIRGLPLIPEGCTLDHYRTLASAEKSLIGFWMGYANTAPRKQQTINKYMRHRCWNAKYRERVASQVNEIKHWRVICGDYTDAPNSEATWFIDPPYVKAGDAYRFGSSAIDFDHLGRWCRSRVGQVLVCENEGASWLPFERFHATNGVPVQDTHSVRKTHEYLWNLWNPQWLLID